MCWHQNLPHRAVVRGMGSRALKSFANCLVLCTCALLLLLTALITIMKELHPGWERYGFAWCLCLEAGSDPQKWPPSLFHLSPPERDRLEGTTSLFSLFKERPGKSKPGERGRWVQALTCTSCSVQPPSDMCPFWAQAAPAVPSGAPCTFLPLYEPLALRQPTPGPGRDISCCSE